MERVARRQAVLKLAGGHRPVRMSSADGVLGQSLCLPAERLQAGFLPLVPDRVGEQSQQLLGALLERHVLEPALHLRPFGSAAGAHVLGVAVDGLVQDGDEEEGPLGAGRGLGQFLQHENVALIGIGWLRIQGTCPARPRSAGCR